MRFTSPQDPPCDAIFDPGPGQLRLALISVHGDPLASIGSEGAGGQNVYVREVARALVRCGHKVDVFTRGREGREPVIQELDGVRIIRLPVGQRGYIPRTELFQHLPAFLDQLKQFAWQHRLRYDVIHTNYWLSGWVGMKLAQSWHVPQVHTHHSLGAVKFDATSSRVSNAQVRLKVEEMLNVSCARIVATSPQDVASMMEHYRGLGPVSIVPCGIDPEKFKPLDKSICRLELGLPADGPLIAYVGRFDPNKGIDTFVRAAARVAERHPYVKLLFAGGYDPDAEDAHEFQRICDLVEELGLTERATFLGKVDQADLGMVYSAADLCVVPSHYESFGMVAIEAMACGTPVVASEVGGLRYSVVHRETGLLAKPQDPASFASGISLLLDDHVLRDAMGRSGARLVGELFTWDAIAARLEDVYAVLVEQPAEVGRVG
jgi:glycosyltransferase involved in cell wall biosynthesis